MSAATGPNLMPAAVACLLAAAVLHLTRPSRAVELDQDVEGRACLRSALGWACVTVNPLDLDEDDDDAVDDPVAARARAARLGMPLARGHAPLGDAVRLLVQIDERAGLAPEVTQPGAALLAAEPKGKESMSDPLTHYMVVRRDLPLGVLAAQIVHAAGESFFKLAGSSAVELRDRREAAAEAGGSNPPPPAFDPSNTIAVVLGARNEARLLRLERQLLASGIEHIAIREPDAPWNGQIMAIGLVPVPQAEKPRVREALRDFHMLSSEP